jgi:hypothetical protein
LLRIVLLSPTVSLAHPYVRIVLLSPTVSLAHPIVLLSPTVSLAHPYVRIVLLSPTVSLVHPIVLLSPTVSLAHPFVRIVLLSPTVSLVHPIVLLSPIVSLAHPFVALTFFLLFSSFFLFFFSFLFSIRAAQLGTLDVLNFTGDRTVGKVALSIGWKDGKLNDLGISDVLMEQAFEIICQRVRKMVEVEFYIDKLRILVGDSPMGSFGKSGGGGGGGDESPRFGTDMGYETGSSNSSPAHSTEYFDAASPPEFVVADAPDDGMEEESVAPPTKRERVSARRAPAEKGARLKRRSNDSYVVLWLAAHGFCLAFCRCCS